MCQNYHNLKYRARVPASSPANILDLEAMIVLLKQNAINPRFLHLQE
jgi:hypothetical protein